MIRWILALVALGLGGLLYLQWSGWPPPAVVQQAPQPPAEAGPAAEPDPLAALGPTEQIEDYASIKERPLFRPDRRPRVDDPADIEPEAPPEETAKLDGMDLAGVMISPGATMAWVKDPSQPAPVRVRPGEVLAGWTVKDIQADRLVLERQGATDTLPLRTFNAPWASPPPPPPPAAKQAPTGKPQEGKGSAQPTPPAKPPSAAAKQRPVRPPPSAATSAPPRAGRPGPPAGKPN
jgi:general secretion pathway protein N